MNGMNLGPATNVGPCDEGPTQPPDPLDLPTMVELLDQLRAEGGFTDEDDTA